MTLEDYLERNARGWPDRIAVKDKAEVLTYAQLWRRVGERAAFFQGCNGYVPLRTSQTVAFLVDYFAIHRAGAVAVPLDKDMPEVAFQSLAAHLSALMPPTGAADVLFTTGTTGSQKGVIISHAAIIANAENLIEAQRGFSLTSKKKPHSSLHTPHFTLHTSHSTLLTGPLNHIGTLSKVWPAVVMGDTMHILDGMKDFNAFFSAIDEAEGCVTTFLVPATLRMLLRFAAEKLSQYADRIDYIETGAAPMAEADMRQLCQLLPRTRLYNTYASTETGIIATHDYQHDGCIVGCLGRPMHHSSIEIADDGHIICRGRTLMMGYVEATDRKSLGNAAPRTAASAASPLRDGALHTADLGRMDAEGRLHLTGRNDDIINVGGFKVAPEEVENAALAHPMVKDCICIAQHHPVMGQTLQLLVVSEGKFEAKPLAQFLQQHLETHKVPLLYKAVDHIERTFNGKLNRKYYR